MCQGRSAEGLGNRQETGEGTIFLLTSWGSYTWGYAEVGADIYVALGLVIGAAQGGAPHAFSMAGLVYIMIGLVFSELASSYPVAGGRANGARRAKRFCAARIAKSSWTRCPSQRGRYRSVPGPERTRMWSRTHACSFFRRSRKMISRRPRGRGKSQGPGQSRPSRKCRAVVRRDSRA